MSCWRISPGRGIEAQPVPDGALSGTGVYETFLGSDNDRLINAHVDRMWNGLKRLGIEPPTKRSSELYELVSGALKNGEVALFQRLRLTAFSAGLNLPAELYLSGRHDTGYTPQQFLDGFRLAVSTQRRDPSCERYEVKSSSIAQNVEARRHAHALGCDEALFLSDASLVLEGAFSNVFAVVGRKLITPPVRGILPGVTRDAVLTLAAKEGIEARQIPVSISELLEDSEEVFITNSVIGVMPVRAILVDDEPERGFDLPGRITQLLAERYRIFAQAEDT